MEHIWTPSLLLWISNLFNSNHSHGTAYILTFVSYWKHIEVFQNSGSPSTNQIKRIWIEMITDSLGKSAETGKGSKAGKAHPTQNMSL